MGKEVEHEQTLEASQVVEKNLPLRCPCCGCKTLDERKVWDTCSVCYWADDGHDDHNKDAVGVEKFWLEGDKEDDPTLIYGINGDITLEQARANYRSFGASQEHFVEDVREPKKAELPDNQELWPIYRAKKTTLHQRAWKALKQALRPRV